MEHFFVSRYMYMGLYNFMVSHKLGGYIWTFTICICLCVLMQCGFLSLCQMYFEIIQYILFYICMKDDLQLRKLKENCLLLKLLSTVCYSSFYRLFATQALNSEIFWVCDESLSSKQFSFNLPSCKSSFIHIYIR